MSSHERAATRTAGTDVRPAAADPKAPKTVETPVVDPEAEWADLATTVENEVEEVTDHDEDPEKSVLQRELAALELGGMVGVGGGDGDGVPQPTSPDGASSASILRG